MMIDVLDSSMSTPTSLFQIPTNNSNLMNKSYRTSTHYNVNRNNKRHLVANDDEHDHDVTQHGYYGLIHQKDSSNSISMAGRANNGGVVVFHPPVFSGAPPLEDCSSVNSSLTASQRKSTAIELDDSNKRQRLMIDQKEEEEKGRCKEDYSSNRSEWNTGMEYEVSSTITKDSMVPSGTPFASSLLRRNESGKCDSTLGRNRSSTLSISSVFTEASTSSQQEQQMDSIAFSSSGSRSTSSGSSTSSTTTAAASPVTRTHTGAPTHSVVNTITTSPDTIPLLSSSVSGSSCCSMSAAGLPALFNVIPPNNHPDRMSDSQSQEEEQQQQRQQSWNHHSSSNPPLARSLSSSSSTKLDTLTHSVEDWSIGTRRAKRRGNIYSTATSIPLEYFQQYPSSTTTNTAGLSPSKA